MTVSSDLALIESRIADAVDRFMALAADDTIEGPCLTISREVARQALVSSEGGKRLRALLALHAFDATDPQGHDDDDAHARGRDAVLDLACAIEVFQTAALVHDDIIDDSDLRRGKPAAHKALGTTSHSASLGRGLGIMLGDLLATASVDIAHAAAQRMPRPDMIVSTFLRVHREVEIGQVLDLAVELSPLDEPERLARESMNVFRWKTASYTTIAPLEFALLASGRDPRRAHADAMAIGLPLGQAFQLADDLLDVIGSSRSTGKPVGGDIREGKRTVLLADAISGADQRQRRTLIDMFSSQSRGDDDVRRCIELFEGTGAIDRSRRRIRALWQGTLHAIGDLRLPPQDERTLTEACMRFIPIIKA